MSRQTSHAPPSYLAFEAQSADRPQLARGTITSWDQIPAINQAHHRAGMAMQRAERRQSSQQLQPNPSIFDSSSDLPPSNGHSNDAAPTRERRSLFIPAYLEGSRIARRLRHQEKQEQAELQEQMRKSSSTQSAGLSASSSSSNLTKAIVGMRESEHMHRGVARRVVERFPDLPDGTRRVRPLPTRWSEEDKSSGMETLPDGLDLRFIGHLKTMDEAASIRTDNFIPKETGVYYYEVELRLKGKEGLIGLGLARKSTNLSRQPGWEAESFAYHGDDGSVYSGSSNGHPYGPKYTSGDTIGCGVNFRQNSIFFTKNGVFLGEAFKDVKTDRLYPIVGLRRSGEYLKLNLGQEPFAFHIAGYVKNQQALVRQAIHQADTSKLSGSNSEHTLIRKLVGQFLAHEGYIETAKAFSQDVRAMQSISPSEQGQSLHVYDEADDMHAIHRQKIRTAVLEGNIDRALKFTRTYYPRVLDDKQNRDIYFRLRCRKFVEMMRVYAEASQPDNEVSNGHHTQEDNTQMELDDQLQREASNGTGHDATDDIDMEASSESMSKRTYINQADLLLAAIEYGQSLKADFDSDTRPAVQTQLSDIFALMAYPDPRDSPVGELLDTSGRASIAEDLNGAILVSLGKPASAALEKLCSQTTAFLDATANKVGGDAAFVDLETDILEQQ